jgi:hypothetical protein
LTLADAFDKAEELEKHAKQKVLAPTKINETSVDYMHSTSNRGNYGAQRGQSGGRGNKPQNQQRGGYNQNSNQQKGGSNSSPSASSSTLSNTGTKPQLEGTNYKGNTQRGRGKFPSSKGVTCCYCLQLNHFANDCREIIAKGHAIPVADITEGLYNADYFGEAAQEEVDSMHQSHHSKN